MGGVIHILTTCSESSTCSSSGSYSLLLLRGSRRGFSVNHLGVQTGRSGRGPRELKSKFNVEEIPTVVVLRPDGSVLSPNAVPEICNRGPDCFQNWKEGAELIDRNFMMAEEFDDTKMRSMTDPLRRLKYKVDKKKKKKRESREEEDDDEEEEEQNDNEEEEEEDSSC